MCCTVSRQAVVVSSMGTFAPFSYSRGGSARTKNRPHLVRTCKERFALSFYPSRAYLHGSRGILVTALPGKHLDDTVSGIICRSV